MAQSAARAASSMTAPDGPRITIEGVRHVYKGGTVALDGVDLQIGHGLFGLLGPNGAGKSTLMRIICTLLRPTSGRVRVCGHDVAGDRRAVRRVIGYLPQEFGAWRLQRVEEVLDTLGSLSGLVNGSDRAGRIQAVLEQVGLDDVADRKVKALSGGMVRRLGVAQALLHEPPVLVVDEPTVGLDPEERLRFRRLMAELGRERAIVLSTHIVADLGSGCTDLALIDRGVVRFRGSPATLVERARGRVATFTASATTEVPRLPPGAEVVSRTVDGGNAVFRVVLAEPNLPTGASPASDVTLEEAYLAFMAAEGRADAVAAREEVAS
jgi:ABC-type multidrug transport system ATPase subunit